MTIKIGVVVGFVGTIILAWLFFTAILLPESDFRDFCKKCIEQNYTGAAQGDGCMHSCEQFKSKCLPYDSKRSWLD